VSHIPKFVDTVVSHWRCIISFRDAHLQETLQGSDSLHAYLLSFTSFSFSIQRKSQSEQHKSFKLANTYQNNIKEIRSKRIYNLITKINRTEQEEKQLKYV
jgi:hypothetical protein